MALKNKIYHFLKKKVFFLNSDRLGFVLWSLMAETTYYNLFERRLTMILKTRKRFDKYVIGRRRESCGYREVYDAKYNDAKVVLTVYDVEQTPPTLFTDQIISSDLKPLPREVWLLEQLTGKPFPHMIEAGRKRV